MLMKKYNGVMYFDTDDDFYRFCVDPQLCVKTYDNNGEPSEYLDFNFSPGYSDALANNIAFVIRNMNSQILKHNGVVSYRTISKKVDNLKPWYYEKIFSNQNLKECKLEYGD